MKFKYKDKVKIIKGFYKGVKGEVRNESKVLGFEREYIIRTEDDNVIWFKESNLELIKEKKTNDK